MEGINAITVGKYFYNKNEYFSDIQIQKLTYYAYVWYMVKNSGNKLFEEKPQAWVHGPVFRTLYNAMKNKSFYSEKFNVINNTNINYVEIINILDIVYNVYGDYSGNELERLTHLESPWKKARKNLEPWERSEEELDDDEIMKCYGHSG